MAICPYTFTPRLFREGQSVLTLSFQGNVTDPLKKNVQAICPYFAFFFPRLREGQPTE